MYTCLAFNFADLQKRIVSTKRLLNGYGCDLKFEPIRRYEKEVPVYAIDKITNTMVKKGTVIVEVYDYEFEMEDFKVGDYTPVALIEHDVVNDKNNPEIKNVVTMLSNTCSVQNGWYSIGGHCDDCNDKYLRQKTVMLYNNEDGSFRQIGMSCLKKYLGISCFNVIKNFRNIEEIVEEENNIYVSFEDFTKSNYYNTERYLACVYDVIKLIGRIRYKTVEEAKKLYNDDNYNPSFEAEETVKTVKNCFASDMFKEYANNMNNFTQNVASNIFASYTRRFELLTYTFDVYKKYIAWLEKKDRESHSEFVGEVGQKITVEVETSEGYNVETRFGYATINKFTDADGNIYTWFTSTKFYGAGIKLKITGTVKAHNEYNGVKQTVLTRVKEV